MDPCPFAKLIIESLSLKLPSHAAKPTGGPGIHPTTTPCFCKLRLKGFPSQTALLPLSDTPSELSSSSSSSAVFTLDSAVLRRISASGAPLTLRVSVYAGRMGKTCGGGAAGKLVGRVGLDVGLRRGVEARAAVFQAGWVKLGGGSEESRLHIVVRSEPDPRFVFQFGGEPECSPVVFQIQGSIRQPVFSCKFSADRNSRFRSLPSDFNSSTPTSTNHKAGWMRRTFSGEREKLGRERKGWMVVIHDLSGSPVAAASMITPFVPSPGSDRVSRSNPGAWLILRPTPPNPAFSWQPWGRLEAWRDRGGPLDGLGYKFELVAEGGPTAAGIPIAEDTMSVKKGGQFCIDSRAVSSWHGSYNSSTMNNNINGFVMGSTVEGEGKVSKPVVQVGVQHVTCMPDAALFVALSAAIDLSMDACRLFSSKLRKELCHDDHDLSS